MENDATEETALLQEETMPLPLLQPYLDQLEAVPLEEMDQAHLQAILQSEQLSSHRALLTSFSLIVLLVFRDQKVHVTTPRSGPWEVWKHETVTEAWLNSIDASIEHVWNTFLGSFCSSRDVETALWREFRLNENDDTVRVMDFLLAHPRLLNDRVIELSLRNRWKQGPTLDLSRSRHYLTSRYDALCTPRVLHALELAPQIAFLFLLASYVLNPPHTTFFSQPLQYIGPREIALIMLSGSISLRPWTAFVLPFVLTLIAFLFKLPSAPLPQNFSFDLLLFSLVLHLLQLHISFPPSPLFLFWPDRALPLATVIVTGVLGTMSRVVLFFFPIMIFSAYFLFFALSDVFLRVPSTLVPAPIETRQVFLVLSAVAVIAFVLSLALVTSFISSPSASGSSPWDRYSVTTGTKARINFYRAVIRYSKPYPFPPPFNVLSFVFISIPSFALRMFGISDSSMFIKGLEKIMWRLAVGPFVVIARVLMLFLP